MVAVIGAADDSGAAGAGGSLFRSGGSNPGSLKLRPGEEGLSFRDSLSNPIGAKDAPVFRPGAPYIEVDASQLPAGSVFRDNVPHGHVTVSNATVDEIKAALQ